MEELLAGGSILTILVVLFLAIIILYFIPLNLWITAVFSGVRLNPFKDLLGMRLRKVPPVRIVKPLITAHKAGIHVPADKLEAHYLAGGRVQQVVNALISADKANIDLNFERATAIDLAGRDVFEAVQVSVNPKVIETPAVSAVAKDGIQVRAIARVTVRANIDRLVGGAGEETIIARVGEGIVSTIGSSNTHKEVLENPDSISKVVLSKGLDSGTAFEILSIDIADVDVGSYVEAAQEAVRNQLDLPSGYSINWSGQYEYMLRAEEKLTYVVPLTLAIIIVLLFMNFRNFVEVAIIMGTLPLAMVGSIWLMYLQGYNFSIAVGVGFIALAGVAVEIGVIMLVYLNQSYQQMLEDHERPTDDHLKEAVLHGAGMRIRPIMMTAGSVIVGLLPILYGSGTGSEVMSRIATPMVGGMVSAMVLTLLVLPAIYYLWRKYSLQKEGK